MLGLVSSFSPLSTETTSNVVVLETSGLNSVRKDDRSDLLANDSTKLLTASEFADEVAGVVGMLYSSCRHVGVMAELQVAATALRAAPVSLCGARAWCTAATPFVDWTGKLSTTGSGFGCG